LSQAQPSFLLFAGLIALTSVASLGGGVLLLRKKRAAIPLLSFVFVANVAVFVVAAYDIPIQDWSVLFMVILFLSAATIAYSMFLVRKGFLK